MNSNLVNKMISLIIVFSLLSSPMLAQEVNNANKEAEQPKQDAKENNAENCIQGTKDGELDAKASGGYFLAGLGCGVIGFAIAAGSNPSPKAVFINDMMKNKGTDYTYCYQEAYEAKSRRKNMQIAGAGWAIGAGVALLILFSSN